MTDQKPVPEPTEEDMKTAKRVWSRWSGVPEPGLASAKLVEEIALALAHEREKAAKVAEDPSNYDMIGGSTGNAYGTGQLIAAAIRSGGRE